MTTEYLRIPIYNLPQHEMSANKVARGFESKGIEAYNLVAGASISSLCLFPLLHPSSSFGRFFLYLFTWSAENPQTRHCRHNALENP